MHKLKENLKQELYELEEKVERNPKARMSLQELQRANLASDTVKNICKIDALDRGEGYSGDTDFMGEGRLYGTSYRSNDDYMYNSNGGQGGSSHARGRDRNARRDSHGRYSRDGAKENLIEKLEEAMDEADNEHDREKIRRFIMQIENA